MAIDRGPFNALVDDDGSNTIGTPWNKAAIAGVILDPVDAALVAGTLLNAEGSSTDPGAAALSIASVPGLLAYDTIVIEIEGHCIPTALPGALLVIFQNSTSTVLMQLDTLVPGSTVLSARVYVRRATLATGNTAVMAQATVRGNTASALGGAFVTGVSWNTPWQLVWQHNGVAAGSTFSWKWSVARVAHGA